MSNDARRASNKGADSTADAIRRQRFPVRMRGLDEIEVDRYLLLLADQFEAGDRDRRELAAELDAAREQLSAAQAEAQRLRTEVSSLTARMEHLAAEAAASPLLPAQPLDSYDDDHAVALFEQAQAVVDGLMEDAVRRAREIIDDARRVREESFYWETSRWATDGEHRRSR